MKFGRYQLSMRLATGGMAEVFLAHQTGLAGFEKVVALKRILPHLSESAAFVEMFLHEARIAALLDHPHIAHIYDFGSESGLYYLAMEYVPGETLLAIVKRAHERQLPVPPDAAATILIAVCDALHYVHEARGTDGRPLGIVHRDVTPSNVMVTYDGAVKLVDFGVAQTELGPAAARPGVLKGKCAYMSPRQSLGQEVDRRADVWSLGVCAWELVTGKRLFHRESEPAMMQAVRQEPVPRPDAVRPDLPRGLADIIVRALDRDLSRRWESCETMQLALEEFLSSSGTLPSKITLSRYLRNLFGQAQAERQEHVAAGHFSAEEGTAPLDSFVEGPAPAPSGRLALMARPRRLAMMAALSASQAAAWVLRHWQRG